MIRLFHTKIGFYRIYPSGFYVDPMFPEKIEFDGKTYRTNSYNKVLDLIYQQTNELRGVEKKSGESFSTFSASVPRPAFEILNINRREQILFTTKSHVFTYI